MSEYIAECYGSANGGTYTEMREEIVRCRDCRYAIADGNGCGVHADYVDTAPDGFCNRGERREQ